MKNEEARGGCLIIGAILLIVLLAALWIFLQPGSLLGYWLWGVGSDEVGVELDRGVFVQVLGPGYYSAPFDLGADIQNVATRAIPIELVDQAVLTNKTDQQQLTVDVQFNVFRPGFGVLDENRWRNYRLYYTDEGQLRGFVNAAARDSIRACFNASTFQEAVGGEGRTSLADCIVGRLGVAFEDSGLRVDNMFITNIDPSEAAMARLEEIRDVNQQRDLSNANAQLAEANAYATSAVIESQYNARATQAAAEEQSIRAQQSVLEAQATYDAADAQYELALSEINLHIAQLKAQADTASEAALAIVYQQYPQYAYVVTQQLLASSLVNVQWGYLQPGQSPLTVITNPATGELGYVVPNAPGFAPTATQPAP